MTPAYFASTWLGDVTDAKRAQVEDIVKRKTGISAENIVITPLSQ